MTRDEMIKLAIEAGWQYADGDDGYSPLWRFAALVAAAEREACARVCEEQGKGRKALEHYAALTYSGSAHDCAEAIRARVKK